MSHQLYKGKDFFSDLKGSGIHIYEMKENSLQNRSKYHGKEEKRHLFNP